MAVYLDYNATTPLAPSVIERITEALSKEWGNPSSCYEPGLLANHAISEARNHMARMIGGSSTDIVFTSGGTEANNMVIAGVTEYYNAWVKEMTSSGFSVSAHGKPHVITSNVEHDATILPLRHMERKGLISLSVVPVQSGGYVDASDIISQVQINTCLVTIMHANNETGIIMPLEEIGRQLSLINQQRVVDGRIRILFHSDAAQSIGKIPVNVVDLQVDYLSIVGHKFYGPRIGCVYARGLQGGVAPLYPLLHGGGQEEGYRPGTVNTPMVAGLGEAARLVGDNLEAYGKHMAQMRDYLEAKLEAAFPGSVSFNCRSPSTPRLPNTTSVSFASDRLHGRLLLSSCPRLMASTTAACHDQNVPSSVLIRSGVEPRLAANAVRMSVGRGTTERDVDVAVEELERAVREIMNKPL